MISYSHDTTLVVASIAVSMVAAFSGLALTNNISRLPSKQRKALIVMSSFVLGGGIWSMHFVAMLAHKLSVPVYYDVFQTMSSALVAILVVGTALLLLHFTSRSPLIIAVSGLILAAGILSMHYIGMLGIRGVVPEFSAISLAVACVVACLMGVAAIGVAYGNRSKQNIVAGSLLMGSSVVVVHYTAMYGTRFVQSSEAFSRESTVLATGTLAVIVTLAVFVICGSFLLAAATFLTTADHGNASALAAKHTTGSSINTAVSTSVVNPQNIDSPAAGEIARADLTQAEAEFAATASTPSESVKIPFEKDKKIGYAMSADVAAIRADGHYTHLYTQDGTRFCPWSITEAEQRLGGFGFHRTHRSYLVNVNAIAGYEKRKETGICLFENYPNLTSVPVSRNRVIGLMKTLDAVEPQH